MIFQVCRLVMQACHLLIHRFLQKRVGCDFNTAMNILKCCHNLLRLKYQTPDEEHVSVNTSVNPHSNQPTENPLANFQALRFVGRMPLPLWEGMETLSEVSSE